MLEDICMLIICIVRCIKREAILFATRVINSEKVEIFDAKSTQSYSDRMKNMEVNKTLCGTEVSSCVQYSENLINHLHFFLLHPRFKPGP